MSEHNQTSPEISENIKTERLSKKYDFSDKGAFSELDKYDREEKIEKKTGLDKSEPLHQCDHKGTPLQGKQEAQNPEISKKTTLSKLVSFLKNDSIKNTLIIGSIVTWALPFFEFFEKIQNTKKTITEFTEKFSFKNLIPSFFQKKEVLKKTSLFDKMLSLGKKHLGGTYSWGKKKFTEGRKGGLDCSGFTQSLYASIGIKIPEASFLQADDKNAKKITDQKKLQKGDLVFFLTDKNRAKKEKIKVTHVAMYIGNGEIIHARSSAKGIRKDRLEGGDFKGKFQWARRYPLNKKTQIS